MPSPTVTVSNNATICGGDLITLTASGGTTYTWSNGATSSATIVSPATTTSYSVIAKSGMCADTGKITIAEVEELVPAGELDPDQIHTPGIFIKRIFQGEHFEKRIEQRTVQKR